MACCALLAMVLAVVLGGLRRLGWRVAAGGFAPVARRALTDEGRVLAVVPDKKFRRFAFCRAGMVVAVLGACVVASMMLMRPADAKVVGMAEAMAAPPGSALWCRVMCSRRCAQEIGK